MSRPQHHARDIEERRQDDDEPDRPSEGLREDEGPVATTTGVDQQQQVLMTREERLDAALRRSTEVLTKVDTLLQEVLGPETFAKLN